MMAYGFTIDFLAGPVGDGLINAEPSTMRGRARGEPSALPLTLRTFSAHRIAAREAPDLAGGVGHLGGMARFLGASEHPIVSEGL
jgi:hypothetical protein